MEQNKMGCDQWMDGRMDGWTDERQLNGMDGKTDDDEQMAR